MKKFTVLYAPISKPGRSAQIAINQGRSGAATIGTASSGAIGIGTRSSRSGDGGGEAGAILGLGESGFFNNQTW